VLLDLILGTNVGLESLTLQRKTGQGYEDMMTIQSIENTSYVWYDPKPVPGSNFYRIKVVRSNEQIIYSQDEEVIYTRSQDITFFPNPVKPNEPLYVIVNSEVTRFDVYDLLGRLVHQAMDDGEIKTIDPINIPEGVYVIKAITQEGKTLSRRVVVR
jgi:hypothetical protein